MLFIKEKLTVRILIFKGTANEAALICQDYGKDILTFDSTEEYEEFYNQILTL